MERKYVSDDLLKRSRVSQRLRPRCCLDLAIKSSAQGRYVLVRVRWTREYPVGENMEVVFVSVCLDVDNDVMCRFLGRVLE